MIPVVENRVEFDPEIPRDPLAVDVTDLAVPQDLVDLVEPEDAVLGLPQLPRLPQHQEYQFLVL